MDRRAWQATVHGVAKSRTQLNAQVCRVLWVRCGHLRTHPGRQRDTEGWVEAGRETDCVLIGLLSEGKEPNVCGMLIRASFRVIKVHL